MALNFTHTLILPSYRVPCYKVSENPPKNHRKSLMGRNAHRRPNGSRNRRNGLKLDIHTHIINIQVSIFFKSIKSNKYTPKGRNWQKMQIASPLGRGIVRMGWNLTKTLIQSISNYPTSKNWLKPKTEQSYSLLVSYCCCSCFSCWRTSCKYCSSCTRCCSSSHFFNSISSHNWF